MTPFPWPIDFIEEIESPSDRDRVLRIKRVNEGRRSPAQLAADSLPISREGQDRESVQLWLRNYHHWPHSGPMTLELRYCADMEAGLPAAYITQASMVPNLHQLPGMPPGMPYPPQMYPPHTSAAHGGHSGEEGQSSAASYNPTYGAPPYGMMPYGYYQPPSVAQVAMDKLIMRAVDKPELVMTWLQGAVATVAEAVSHTPEGQQRKVASLMEQNQQLMQQLQHMAQQNQGFQQALVQNQHKMDQLQQIIMQQSAALGAAQNQQRYTAPPPPAPTVTAAPPAPSPVATSPQLGAQHAPPPSAPHAGLASVQAPTEASNDDEQEQQVGHQAMERRERRHTVTHDS